MGRAMRRPMGSRGFPHGNPLALVGDHGISWETTGSHGTVHNAAHMICLNRLSVRTPAGCPQLSCDTAVSRYCVRY